MRVDEPRQDDDVPEVHDLGSRAVAARGDHLIVPARDDAIAIGEHPAVAQRRRGDGQDPGGAVEDHWPVRRAFFSAALRAA